MALSFVQFSILLAVMSVISHAREELFLARQADPNSTKLLAALEGVLGRADLEARLPLLEARLQPMFLSLAKAAPDLLSHAAARYALHRINVDLHGWSISGLEPNETTFNTTSLVGSGILSDLLPQHIEAIFVEHVRPNGFSLRDLSVLASTIERLVHDDQAIILRKVCEVLELPTVGAMTGEEMRSVILMYKSLFLVGFSSGITLPKFTSKIATLLMKKTPRAYPGWDDAVAFVEDEIAALAFNEKSVSNPFQNRESSFDVAVRVVEQIADHFAPKSAEVECQEIKEDLLAFERGDSGRIRLADFYRAGLESRFYFVETKEYLQAIGALDDTDTVWGPKVIVSNYVLSKSNCLAHGHYYSVCCINECEGLYGNIERAIAAADATPAQLASLVSSMSSSTVQAPRNLSESLVRRLEEIKLASGGSVRLHSRLFAQWMHQAFPRECPYPHLTGTVTSLDPNAWVKKNGGPYRIDTKGNAKEAMARHAELHDPNRSQQLDEAPVEDDVGDLSMWTLEEEHFDAVKPSLMKRTTSMVGTVFKWGSPVMLLALAMTAFSSKFAAACKTDDHAKSRGVLV